MAPLGHPDYSRSVALSRFAGRKAFTALVVSIVLGAPLVFIVQNQPRRDPDRAGQSAPSRLHGLFEFFERLELGGFDLLAQEEAKTVETSPDIVLVSIDDLSLANAREVNLAWPWPRTVTGAVVKELRKLGARLVVIDQIFVDPTTAPEDDGLAEALAEAEDVVAGFSFGTNLPPKPVSGRWAIRKGSYATREAAVLAAAPSLSYFASPYLVSTDSHFEVWLGGYFERGEAATDVERLKGLLDLGPKEKPSIRELNAKESLDRVTVESVFSERNAIEVSGARSLNILERKEIQTPIPQLVASPLQFGSVSVTVDRDGVVRSVHHVVKYEGKYYPSLALAAALRLQGTRQVRMEGGYLKVGELATPIDETGATTIRFYGRRKDQPRLNTPYASVPIFNVIKSIGRRERGLSIDGKLTEQIQGKVVFIANEAASLMDLKATPINRKTVGTVALANALDNLMRHDGLLRAPRATDSILAVVMCLLGAFAAILVAKARSWWEVLAGLLVCLITFQFTYVTWVERSFREGTWVAAAVPFIGFALSLLSTTVWNHFEDRAASEVVRGVLGRYTSPELVELLRKHPEYLNTEGDRRVMTVFFSDIRDFTTISEGMKAQDLVKLINDYLTAMTEVVVSHRGYVDKYIGDAIMAFWGGLQPNPLHARDACACALKMRDVLAHHREIWKEKYGAEIFARAGVNTGEMVVGELGSKGARKKEAQKGSYTVVGDAVNLASRLEGANKTYGTEILLGEATFEAAKEYVEARELDRVRVKGKTKPSRIYELLSMKGALPDRGRHLREQFEEALTLYRERRFSDALGRFESLLKDNPGDVPTQLYVKRCREFLASPPAPTWDGVFEMTEK
jgi:adenylate cyclase